MPWPRGLVICILICCAVSGTYAEDGFVLVIHSYHPGYKWSDDVRAGIRDSLAGLDVRDEYMDTKRMVGEDYFSKIKDIYALKYGSNKPMLIVTADNDAFNFISRYRDEVFPGTPVVFCGVNYIESSITDNLTGFTGLNEKADMISTLDIMRNMHPGTKEILLVADRSVTGQKIAAEFEKLAPVFSGIRFSQLPDTDWSSVLAIVGNMSDGSLVLYSIYFRDNQGAFIEYDRSTELFSQASNVPIYGLWDFSLGHGIIGGSLTSGRIHGTMAGSIAKRILAGEAPMDIPVVMDSPSNLVFDYRQLQRFSIRKDTLPQASKIVGDPHQEPDSLKGRYSLALMFLGVAVVILVVLVSGGLLLRNSKIELGRMNVLLEERVRNRTEEYLKINAKLKEEIANRSKMEDHLKKRNEELEKFNSLTMDRELKMLELKKQLRKRP